MTNLNSIQTILSPQEMHTEYAKEVSDHQSFKKEMHTKNLKVEPEGTPNALQKLFTDPEKMLKLWLIGETKPNPFSDEQKDPMDTFGKFIQAMLMQTQTTALTHLEKTMENNQRYNSAGLIGKHVQVKTNKVNLNFQRQMVKNFIIPKDVDRFSVQVKDINGHIVYDKVVNHPTEGINEFAWSGLDQHGQTLPEGIYQLSVALLKNTSQPNEPQKFEHLEYAKDLKGYTLQDKLETLETKPHSTDFFYEAPEGLPNLAYASVWITNSKGIPVHKGNIELKSGEKGVYYWNGLDENGTQVPDDVYTFHLNLKDAEKKLIQTDKESIIYISDEIQGIEMDNKGELNMIMSKTKSSLSDIQRIINKN